MFKTQKVIPLLKFKKKNRKIYKNITATFFLYILITTANGGENIGLIETKRTIEVGYIIFLKKLLLFIEQLIIVLNL